MNILLVTNHFEPENFKCNDVAFELVRRGHQVTVLTAIPDYPQGYFPKGYGFFKKRVEWINGVKVIRSGIIPRGKGGAIRLALNYFSFAFTASIRAVWMGLRHKYDLILVHETSSVTVGIPAVLIKKIQKTPLYFWVLDLWPESLQAAGGVNNKYVLGTFASITKWIYRNSTKILMSSKSFEQSIVKKGNFAKKLVYFPNWADEAFKGQGGTPYKLPELPDGFKVMFAGNMGEAQDFDHIMEAALQLNAEKNIHFILVGDGRKRGWVEQFIAEHKLQNTVHWVGRHPLETMPLFFEQADMMLVSLKDNLVFKLTAPAKLQAYMSAAKPIIAMINGEASRIVKEANCGFTTSAGNAQGLAELIRKASKMDAKELALLGVNGERYSMENFNFNKQMDELILIVNKDLGCELEPMPRGGGVKH